MIYVLEIVYYDKNNKEVIDLMKIGYTGDNNFENRKQNYILHNPLVDFLYLIPEGTLELESLLQSYFSKYRYKTSSKEWFYFNQEIIDFFDSHKTVESLSFLIEDDMRLGTHRFNGFGKFCYTVIDQCLNLLLNQNHINLEKAMEEREICYNLVKESKLVSSKGVTKFILDHFKIDKEEYNNLCSKTLPSNIAGFIEKFSTLPTFYDKMRAICETDFTDLERRLVLEQVPLSFKNYYNKLGPVTLKACGYNVTNIRNRIKVNQSNEKVRDNLEVLIYKTFLVGNKYTLTWIKETLGILYKDCGFISSPKASDLEKYFELKSIRIPNKETGKRDNGYEILSKRKAL